MHWLSRFRRARMYMGIGHVVLRDLAGADEIRHRREDVRAVDAVALRAEHQVVTRRAPRSLLDHFDVWHAVLGEEALFLGDDQRCGVGQCDEAEYRAWSFPARRWPRTAVAEASCPNYLPPPPLPLPLT